VHHVGILYDPLFFICSFHKVKHICPPAPSDTSQSIAFGIQKFGCACFIWLMLV